MDLLTLAMAKKAASGDAAAVLAEAKQYTDDSMPVCEEGTVTLTNSEKYPFNDSLQSVALVTEQADTSYAVVAEVISSTGDAGEVNVSDKQVNGFKLSYTGGATSAVVHYFVIGGIIS